MSAIDSIWPGWSNAAIPVIVYSEAYAFLAGAENPGPGWRTVPGNLALGGPWEPVPNDSIDGRRYFRQRLAHEHTAPQAFTVRLGELWAGSMTTKDWMDIGMGNEIRDSFPRFMDAELQGRLIAHLHEAVTRLSGRTPQGDDLTAVILKGRSPEE